MANLGNYQAAVEYFTEAINLDSKDFRSVYTVSHKLKLKVTSPLLVCHLMHWLSVGPYAGGRLFVGLVRLGSLLCFYPGF